MEHLEGRQSILSALQARQRKFQTILISHGTHVEKVQDILDKAAEAGVPVRRVARKELDALAHGATHGGVLAVCTAKPRATAAELLEMVERLDEPPLLLLIEGVEDARNLGFTLRSAEALGVHAVLIKKHIWDLDPTEIARPASGAYERLMLAQIEDVAPLRQLQRAACGSSAVSPARHTLYDTHLTGPTILAVGGEKRGLSGAVRSICDSFMTIPLAPAAAAGASSLSLSHASAILVAEAMRQRLAAGCRASAATEPNDVAPGKRPTSHKGPEK